MPDQMMKAETDKDGKEKIPEFDSRNLTYDESRDIYICPVGQELSYKGNYEKNGAKYDVYKSNGCNQCEHKSNCTKGEARKIVVCKDAMKVKKEMREKLPTEEGKKTFMKRLFTVEPVLGYIKRTLGYTYFLLRGIAKTRGEFNLMCIAYNIKKIHLLLLRGKYAFAIKKIPTFA